MTSKSKASAASGAAASGAAVAATVNDLHALMIAPAKPPSCEKLTALVNAFDSRQCAAKFNSLSHLGDHAHSGCSCGGGAGSGVFLADLIVLIDCSGSMTGAAAAVSSAAAAAVKAAKAACNVDLRIAYFGVEGTWPGTVFTTNHVAYLTGLGVPAATLVTNNPTGGYDTEEGANAVEDLSNHYDWRPDACRAIFYISDEELDGSAPRGDVANEALAVASAVAAANAHNVTVFAHHLTYQNLGASVIANYNDLCNGTGGTAFFSAAASASEYQKILAEAICGACGKPTCATAEIPKWEPCISIAWGDCKCDCFETDDTEIVCVTVCNCYQNISFTNFNIAAVFITASGGAAVPLLPDGTPSVQIVPLGPICFGTIPPCVGETPGCVSRQFVIRTRGAKPGPYEVHLAGVCYDVSLHYAMNDAFALTLCAD